MAHRLFVLPLAIASFVGVLQGCSGVTTTHTDPLQAQAATNAKAVPPAREIAATKPAPIGENTIGRYGTDIGAPAKAATVAPVMSLMPVVPQYGPPGMARPHSGYAPYPPPPPGAAPAQEPYSQAVERAVVGGVIGGIIGAQVGSGSGRHVGAGIGAAAGTMIGLGASDNPCATLHGGTLAGAAAGGILGNQVGSGSGRSAATAVGAMLGALAGTHAGAAAQGCR